LELMTKIPHVNSPLNMIEENNEDIIKEAVSTMSEDGIEKSNALGDGTLSQRPSPCECYKSRTTEKTTSNSGNEINRIVDYRKLDRIELHPWFVAGACTECHNIPTAHDRMKACSQCCLVWYCGKECQKNNWKYHKEFCKATKAVATECNASYIMEEAKNAKVSGIYLSFVEYYTLMHRAVVERLNRNLDALETLTLLCPKLCDVCKEANPAVLKPCDICYRVFYCSKEHANLDYARHKTYCPDYLLTLQCYQLVATKGIPIPRNIYYRTSTVSEYKPITGTTKDYLPPTLDVIDILVSDYVSYPLSLIYALGSTGLKNGTKNISEMKELTVLMGDPCNGIHKTMCHNYMWEYMFHLLPKLKKLNLILCELTPQSRVSSSVLYNSLKPLEKYMCSDCISRKCNLSVQSIDEYHKYKLSKEFKKPDVIYNHRVTDQDLTEVLTDLPYADPEVPLVIVFSHKEEIQDSLELMRKKENLKILLPLQLNPFSGMQPTLIYNGSLSYSNCYIVALQRQIKGNCK